MGRMVGIDLGTTNSVVAIVDGPQPRVLDNRDAKSQTRSIVSLKKRKTKAGTEEELLVGESALANWPLAPRDTIVSVKRLMGRSAREPEVERVKEWAEYQVVPPSDGTKDSVRVLIGGKEYSPIDISAMILRKLKEDAEFRLGDKVTHAVITVPAYFSERQRDATWKAGLKAGLKVMKILDEPTAAAYAFGVDAGGSSDPKTVLVYDLGGGTFDISLLMWGANTFAPLNKEGDMWLGGDNFDQVLVDHAIKHIKDEHGIDPATDKRFMAQLRIAARDTKERLTNARSADLIVASSLKDESGDPIDIQMEIAREEYERMIKPLVERTVSITEKALKYASYTADQIDYVLMAGNSTCVPMVQAAMEKMFGAQKVLRKIHPKHCVAVGAALLAYRLKGVVCQVQDCGHVNDLEANSCEKCGASLQAAEEAVRGPAAAEGGVETTPIVIDIGVADVGIAPFHYGTQSAGDRFNIFIRKSEPFPTPAEGRQAMTFFTTAPNQRILSIPVYGGDHMEKASANVLQGQAFAVLPAGLPKETPLRVKLWLDKNGIFDLSSFLEDGRDLRPWIIRGEADAKAIEAIELAERKLAQKGEGIRPEKQRELDEARDRIFEELKKGNYEGALQQAQSLDAMLDEAIAEEGREDIGKKAEMLIQFGEFVLQRFGWAFNPNQAYQLNKQIEETRAALQGRNKAGLAQKVDALDKATNELPEVVKVFVQLGGVIATRIQPVDPAAAGQLIQEMEVLEQAFKRNDPAVRQKFEAYVNRVVAALKQAETMHPQARACRDCGAPVGPGERFCPNGHDTWVGDVKASSTTGGFSR